MADKNCFCKTIKDMYLSKLAKIMKEPNNETKKEKISEIYKKYRIFCYKHKLKSFFGHYFDYMDSSFIIESEPIIHDVDEECLNMAIEHLKVGAITPEEAETILKWDVNNARACLSKEKRSLLGCCGIGQALTTFPFRDINIPKTINNMRMFEALPHAFATVTLPVKDKDEIQLKQYLLDVTYRQFFSTITNNEGCYFDYDEREMKSGPEAGYYVCQTEEGKEFATELLKNGYVELNEKKAQFYIDTSRSVLHYARVSPYIKETRELPKLSDNYLQELTVRQEKIDYSLDEMVNWGYNVDFPSRNKTR